MQAPITVQQPKFLFHTVQSKASLPSGCAICDKEQDLKICTACRVLSYCSKDHQIEHRKDHKEFCNYVRQTQATVKAIEARLGPHPHDSSLPNVPLLLTDS